MENDKRNGSWTKKRRPTVDGDKKDSHHEPRVKTKREQEKETSNERHKSSNNNHSISNNNNNNNKREGKHQEKSGLSKKQEIVIEDYRVNGSSSAKTLLTYPPNSGRSRLVSLIAADIETLNPKELINDQVVDFYLQYLYREKLTPRQRRRTHVFSSYFFPSLQMGSDRSRSHHRASMLRNWMKNVNIFTKDFLFVPISLRSHWFLAVICFPAMNLSPESYETFEAEVRNGGDMEDVNGDSENDDNDDGDVVKKPIILLFDSMKKYTSDHALVYRTLWNFLTSEVRRQNNLSAITFTAATMPAQVVDVPQQPNKCDCGLFVFKYFESFFTDPITNYEYPVASMKKWFSRREVINSRERIYNLILGLTHQYFPQNVDLVPTLKYCFDNLSGDDGENGDTCN